MAPASRLKNRDDDDFVFTISDNDDDFPTEEVEEEDGDAAGGLEVALPNRKRKREDDTSSRKKQKAKGDATPAAAAAIEENGKKNKNKKQKKDSKKEEVEESESAEGQEDEVRDWTAEAGEDDGAMASDFEFQVGDMDTGVVEDFDGWGLGSKDEQTQERGNKKAVDIDAIIARRQKNKPSKKEKEEVKEDAEEENESDFEEFDDQDELLAEDGFGMGADGNDEEEENGEEDENESEESGSDDGDADDAASDNDSVATPVPHPDDGMSEASSDDEEEDPEEAKRRADFFAPEESYEDLKTPVNGTTTSFQSLSLSRPILKGLASVGFSSPTPIQLKTIPVALLGKDVVGGAVTGSGKTAAFVIPILERLLYRPKKIPTTRVVILMPTRELAVQCFNVAKKLAGFTDITFAQIVGGFSLREQEQVLRTRPDVVIATPGRFIDHMRNSASFAVDTIEILVLDEADRMLEDGFANELNEILTTIPKSRQTMLFSATMTDSVDKLIRVGLTKPVRLMVNAKKQTVSGLVQEFVRLRPGKEDKRLAYLMYLCQNVYTDRVIIFFRQKREAHRVRVMFGLCGLKAGELHGSMSQEQRIQSVEMFRSNSISFLLATDLASRGLDIKGVDTVINYEAPQSHEIYLHRVGRTARAGRTGRACTLAAEPDRKVVKAAVKAGRSQGAKIVSRSIPMDEADEWAEKVTGLEDEIEEILKEEKQEKLLAQAERDIKKGANLVQYENEIMSRPKRTWFESEKDKKTSKERGAVELNGVSATASKKKKLSGKEKKKLALKDERLEGKVWKKGKAERAGKGALANGYEGQKKGGKSKSKAKVGGGGKGKPRK